MTAILPLPAAVTLFKLAIVVKFLLKVVTDTVPEAEELPEVVVVDDEVLLPQAAASSPPASSIGTSARLALTRILSPQSGQL